MLFRIAGVIGTKLQTTVLLLNGIMIDLSAGRNPFDGFTPSVPSGTKLDYGSQTFQEYENEGEDCTSLSHTYLFVKAKSLSTTNFS